MPDDKRLYPKSDASSKEASQDPLPTLSRDQKISINDFHDRQKNREKNKAVAIVHDWLNGMRGGEIVFEAILDLFPQAEVFTLVYEPQKLSASLRAKLERTQVHVSWLNRFSMTRKKYRQLLPLLPFTVRFFNLARFDLIISSSHCVAKGVKKRANAYHISYLHAPMRYMWDRFDDYFGKGRIHPILRWVARAMRPFIRFWDVRTAQSDRIDRVLANSQFIAAQIQKFYHRDATVIYPFSHLDRFQKTHAHGNYYLMVGAFAPYKRTDLAIEAFSRLGLPLKIVGQGQDREKLMALKEKLRAQNIQFLGNPSNDQIDALYSQCKALIFPGQEDFGITPLEAMAAGAPVIAFASGGACETVTAQTGILFKPQSVEAIVDAVMDIESGRRVFSADDCRARAKFFTEARFKSEILATIPEKFL